MPICIHCGVELDDGLKICPLCGKNPENSAAEAAGPASTPSAILKIHKKEQRRSLWELSTILLFSGIVICLMVDLLTVRGFQWAPLASVQILLAWVVLTLFLFSRKRPLLLLAGTMVAVLATLAATDLFAGGFHWFLPVGLPITAAAFLFLSILLFFHRRIPLNGLNLPGAGLLLIAGFCMVTEIILDLFMTGSIDLRWSLITTVSLLPLALILFFTHYRLKKGRRLETLFHV